MRSKKRVLVTAFGATVALTLQTPVSAFIVGSRKAAVATAVAHHNPPSYLADAFSDAGRRVLRADRWNGWRAGAADSALADDLDSAPVHQARVDSTLGGVDLGYVGAAQGSNSSIAPAGGDSATANASFTGGSGSGGGGGGGGAAGGGGGGGAGGVGAGDGADGLSAGDEASGSLVAAGSVAGNASHGFAAGEFGTLPGADQNSAFPAVPGVLVTIDPANGILVPTPQAVESPEPGTLLFLGAGLAGLAARRARRSRSGRGQSATH
jgi:hypothetical protein